MNVPISSAKTTITVLVFICAFGFAHITRSQTKSDQDGPVSVKYDRLFQPGELKIEPFGLKDLPALPDGFVALNNTAYRVDTTAIVAGNHIIRFAVPSVTNEDVFKKLLILHADTDPFDPDGYVWNDVTMFESASAPNFTKKTIYGKSEGLGIYVIAKQVREVPPSNAIADLVVTTSGAVDRLTSPSLISYTIKVHNKGPDNATDVGLSDGQSGHADLVSVEPSRGKCKPSYNHILCKLGSLKAGESITIAVKLKPYEGRGLIPKEGQEATHNAFASALEKDLDLQNNEASGSVLVFPDPNQLPSVTLNRPEQGAMFVAPSDITLEATAIDPDGTISKVEFFDNEKSLGLGTSVDGKNFVLTARGVSYGNHIFVAVVTDNGGRTDWSVAKAIFVNGLAVVSVKSPAPDSLVPPGPELVLKAVVSHPTGVIDKVQFFSHSRMLGDGTLSGQNTYTFNWKEPQIGHQTISIIAIDGSGIPTLSVPVNFRIGKAPEVAITSPTAAARLSASTNMSITATAKHDYEFIRRVDVYANDKLIGSAERVDAESYRFTWINVPEGQYTLKAVAMTDSELSGTSKPVIIKVEKPYHR